MLENEILKDQNWVLKPIYMLLLVNYSRNRMTYRFLDLNSNDIYECKDIKFFENFSKSDFPKKKKKKDIVCTPSNVDNDEHPSHMCHTHIPRF
jgi:hypothetical protein